jgi:ubiquinone/menaquinone biosynthesis C-methylase UbiE
MSEFDLLIDLHINNPRQGPGSDAVTQQALEMTDLSTKANLQIADIGCGTGAQTMVLAEQLAGQITAVDLFPEFLEVLDKRATEKGLTNISTIAASMDELPFESKSLDLIWSEGAVYILGFETGIRYWHQFLKPGGYLAVSEITWLTDSRPKEIEDHWQVAYPQIDIAANKINQLKQSGYKPIGHFMLPSDCWLENYYHPLQAGFDAFLSRHPNNADAKQIVAEEKVEIELYSNYKDYISYGFYIAQKE